MSVTLASLGLPDSLLGALARQGIEAPFPIQAAAIPPAMSGKDIMGRAPTGSGKTLAFGLPLLSKVGKGRRQSPRALVLAPTRELAEQIKKDLAPLAEAAGRRVSAVYGGVGYGPQLSALRRGVDVLVATPGRLEDLIERRSVDLKDVDFVVVDEADRMADMGFFPAVRRILDGTKSKRQTLLFSATLDGDVRVLSRDYQSDPISVEAEAMGGLELDLVHHFWRVGRSDRLEQIARLITDSGRSIVFTRTRHGADRLVKQLAKAGVATVAMHGGRSQSQRTRALREFSTGKAGALIATDVAARGIHVEDVTTVVHFDVAADHKDYLHRSGRTARAGATGTVVTFVTEGQEGDVRKLQRKLGIDAPIERPTSAALATGGHRPSAEGPSSRRAPSRSNGKSESKSKSESNGRPARSTGGSRNIFVGNLPWETTPADLEELFADHGDVERATISRQRKTGRSKGFGFVDMPASQQKSAIAALDGAILGGRPIRVRPAK